MGMVDNGDGLSCCGGKENSGCWYGVAGGSGGFVKRTLLVAEGGVGVHGENGLTVVGSLL